MIQWMSHDSFRYWITLAMTNSHTFRLRNDFKLGELLIDDERTWQTNAQRISDFHKNDSLKYVP